MLSTWILAFAFATEPAAVELTPPTHALATELSDGAVLRPTARELARTRRPRGVSFQVEGKPQIVEGRLVVEGVLHNAGREEVTVFLERDEHREGPLLLVPRGVSYRLEAPDGRVSPAELVLPPGGKAVFRSALVLDHWAWPEDGAPVDWVFHFWGSEEKGSLPGMLSPP